MRRFGVQLVTQNSDVGAMRQQVLSENDSAFVFTLCFAGRWVSVGRWVGILSQPVAMSMKSREAV